jgi:hypothetical protein
MTKKQQETLTDYVQKLMKRKRGRTVCEISVRRISDVMMAIRSSAMPVPTCKRCSPKTRRWREISHTLKGYSEKGLCFLCLPCYVEGVGENLEAKFQI